ncbi:MAG: ATP-binding protein [Ruminiclostridium sp.]|nr:ATP-binding protein [Ruminiclostridium sp.]
MMMTEMICADLSWKEISVSLSSLDIVKSDISALTDNIGIIKKAVLVCDELITNIVLYSGAENMGFACIRSDHGLFIGLYDDGVPFDPTTYENEEKDPLDLDSGGMGIAISAQTVSEWQYQRTNGRNIILLKICCQGEGHET